MTTDATLAPCPTAGFAVPPYTAVEYFPGGWAGVENAQGFNCLSFPSKPGAKFTDMPSAQRISGEWNRRAQAPAPQGPALVPEHAREK